MAKMKETGRCALCGGPYTHWGNNPEPVRPFGERVCDECNRTIVIPARIFRLRRWDMNTPTAVIDKQGGRRVH